MFTAVGSRFTMSAQGAGLGGGGGGEQHINPVNVFQAH